MELGAIYCLITFTIVLLVYAILTYGLLWKIKGGGLDENESMIQAMRIKTKHTRTVNHHRYNNNKTRFRERYTLSNRISVSYAWYQYEYKGKTRTVKLRDTEGTYLAWFDRIGSRYIPLTEYNESFPEELPLLINAKTGKYKYYSSKDRKTGALMLVGFILAAVITIFMARNVFHYVPEVYYDFFPRK